MSHNYPPLRRSGPAGCTECGLPGLRAPHRMPLPSGGGNQRPSPSEPPVNADVTGPLPSVAQASTPSCGTAPHLQAGDAAHPGGDPGGQAALQGWGEFGVSSWPGRGCGRPGQDGGGVQVRSPSPFGLCQGWDRRQELDTPLRGHRPGCSSRLLSSRSASRLTPAPASSWQPSSSQCS